MTATTPANANACQLICLTRHIPVVPSQKFRLLDAKVRFPYLPNVRTTTRERGNDFHGGLSTLTGVLALLMVKHLPNGVLSHDRSPHRRIDVVFAPVITTGARVHSQ